MKELILSQLELLKKEVLSTEEEAKESSSKNNSKTDYAYMFGYAVSRCKSATIRIDTIIELVKQSL